MPQCIKVTRATQGICAKQSHSAGAARFLLLPLGESVENKVCKIIILNSPKLEQYKALASEQSPSSRVIIEDKDLEIWIQELLLHESKFFSSIYSR